MGSGKFYMSNYPYISNIKDVLHYIKDKPEFVHVKKEDHEVINYVVNKPGTFPQTGEPNWDIYREFRGIKFCSHSGQIICRPLHKFFNINEREDTRQELFSLKDPSHRIVEKLDGSMVTPVSLYNKEKDFFYIRWMTKMGITDVSMQAEEFVAKNPVYHEFVERLLNNGHYTPVFEWCSRQQRIVIDYPEDRLVLLAIRNMTSGKYEDIHCPELGYREIERVKFYYDYDDMKSFIDYSRDLKDQEGFICTFDNNSTWVKIKADLYVKKHKAKELFSNNKHIVHLILSEEIDDVYPLLESADRKALQNYELKFHCTIDSLCKDVVKTIRHLRNNEIDRKTFALEFYLEKDELVFKTLLYRVFDVLDCELEIEARKAIIENILKNTHKNEKFFKIMNDLKLATLYDKK